MELTRLISGFQISRMIQVVASLGVADLLKDGPRSYDEIAAATGAHPRSMYRLLHALASTGVLEEKADACFSLTDIGECLRSDSAKLPFGDWGIGTVDRNRYAGDRTEPARCRFP